MSEEKNKILKIEEITINEFEKEFMEDYNTLFPKDERRKWEHIQETYSLNIEKFYKIMDNQNIIGFIMLEKLENKPYYIDYFGIKKEHQGHGYGSKTMVALLENVVKEDGICFEIEKENEDKPDTIRRASFYKALNCKEVDSTYDLFNVLYTPYYWDKNEKIYTSDEMAKILFDYYEINMGTEAVKKCCKVCK